MPAVPPEKKQICAAGIMTMGKWNMTIMTIAINPAAYELRKPTKTAVGANGKIVGTSSAGRDPGINLSEIATNAAVISAKNIRTPVIRTEMPAVKVNAWIRGKTNQSTVPAIFGLLFYRPQSQQHRRELT